MFHLTQPHVLLSFLMLFAFSGVISALPKAGATSRTQPATTLALVQATDGALGDTFGKAVAIDGDLMAVGASAADVLSVNNSGVVYLFERDTSAASGWTQRTKLVPPQPEVSQLFGVSVALDGDVLAVGATATNIEGSDTGAVYIFERNQGGPDAWGLRTTLSEAVSSFSGFGNALALQDNRLLVGARGATGQRGAAFLYERTTAWVKIKAFQDDEGVIADYFGEAVALDGDTVMVGQPMSAFNNRDNNGGQIFVYKRNEDGADEWGEAQRLVAATPEGGSRFGAALALEGDTLVIGAPEADSVTLPRIADIGAALVFNRDASTGDWGFATRLALTDGATGGRYGSVVALVGDNLWVGAPLHRGGSRFAQGKVYAYGRDGGGSHTWDATEPLTPGDEALGELFGSSLAADTTTLVIGAPARDDGRGAVYVPGVDEPPPATSQVFLPVVSAIRFVPTGTLIDGGTVEAASGARVGVVAGTLPHDVGVLIETAPPPPESIGENVIAVGSYHVLAATDQIATPADKPLLVGLPVPDGANTDDMALAILLPVESTVGVKSYRWSAVPGRLDDESGLFVATIGALSSNIVNIVLIEHPSLDPIGLAAQPSEADVANGRALPTQASNRFIVSCEPFTTRFTCPQGNRDTLAAELELAYTDFVLNHRFREPNLPRMSGLFREADGRPVLTPTSAFFGVYVDVEPCDDDSGEPFAGLYRYGPPSLHLCMDRSSTGEAIRKFVRHELFHAIQASYPNMYADAGDNTRPLADWTLEGAAAAAELSSASMLVSPRYPAFPVSERLTDNTDLMEYQAQDFWVYTGREGQENLSYLRAIFESGATPEHVASGLDLNESYWKWAKNQAFEKTIRYRPDFEEDACTIERALTGDHEEITWNGSTARASGTLTQLTSKVVEIRFTRKMEAGDIIVTSPDGDTVRHKVYFADGRTTCADAPEGDISIATGRDTTVYVLISNTDGTSSSSYRLTVTGVE